MRDLKILLPAFSLLSLLSCSGARVHKDPSPPAIRSNYPTAEFTACGQLWHGDGVCRLDPKDSVSKINLQIKGYFSGSIRVHSVSKAGQCNYDKTLSYADSQVVSVAIPGLVGTGCTVGIIVSPEFPGATEQAIESHSLSGLLRIRGIDSSLRWEGTAEHLEDSSSILLFVPASGSGPVRTVIRGCNSHYDRVLPVDGDYVKVSLKDIGFHVAIDRTCVLEAVTFGADKRYFTGVISVYPKRFLPLPEPSIKADGKKIRVLTDPVVSFIFLDDVFKKGSEASFSFDSSRDHILRLLSVSGRSVIGQFDAASKEWSFR